MVASFVRQLPATKSAAGTFLRRLARSRSAKTAAAQLSRWRVAFTLHSFRLPTLVFTRQRVRERAPIPKSFFLVRQLAF